jgi:hypothetical protein
MEDRFNYIQKIGVRYRTLDTQRATEIERGNTEQVFEFNYY